MTYLPFQDLQPKNKAHTAEPVICGEGNRTPRSSRVGNFWRTNFERCSLHHHADCIFMQLLNYLKQLLNRDLTTQEPCPKRIAADAGEIAADQSE